ncbi:dihydrofolate reductase-like domain-containing protein [Phlebopus sp. FC_14]|nr:dihydrofolate reductase-like domain-containing protein [Phlebopus sp. FC_14]
MEGDFPCVTLTFAQSLDGKIAGKAGKQLVMSGPESMLMTHWMRSMHDAILVGIGTALKDDPQLNTRLLPDTRMPSNIPQPVILDAYLRLRTDCKLLRNFKEGRGLKPWVCCSPNSEDVEMTARKTALETAGARVITIPFSQASTGLLSIPHLLHKLRTEGIRSVMVEGGATVIGTFLGQAAQSHRSGKRIVDTLVVTVAPKLVGDDGVAYSAGSSGEQLHNVPELKHIRTAVMGRDTVIAGNFS